MCIHRFCRICQIPLTTTDLRVTLCEKHRGHRSRIKWNRKEILCKVCGTSIPVGSRRKYYCKDECAKIGAREEDRLRAIERRKVDGMKRKRELFEKLKVELGE